MDWITDWAALSGCSGASGPLWVTQGSSCGPCQMQDFFWAAATNLPPAASTQTLAEAALLNRP